MKPSMSIPAAATVLVALALAGSASAQVGNFYNGHSDNPNGPTVSPYLNLLQNNAILGGPTSYQSLVKPLIEQRNAIQRQGNSLQQLQGQMSNAPYNGPSARTGTGHTTRFLNYSHFYSKAPGR